MEISRHIRGLAHLGIPVADIEKSIQWYTETLGFVVIYEKNSPEIPRHVAFLQKENLELEMYQKDPAACDEVRSRSHGHLDHLAIQVDDICAVYNEMKKLGCRFVGSEIQQLPFFENGVACFTVLGPNDEKIEFNQRL